eukprot:TRINITY_DN15477_c0_g2_i2.p1 TRINITY_DN15477_c0_g2~~TRINITY_DN15477_c0_g2_i2.p1  ORF type:complete len:214 (+),score=33.62 TRINITY_DN15477_c0_g2_i2:89-730(+)
MPGKQCSRLSPVLQSTKLCKFYAAGKCKRGEACTFAHCTEQIRDQPDLSKTKLCAAFKRSGRCSQGTNCKFAHGNHDRRLVLGGQVLSAQRNPAPPSITPEARISGASQMDLSFHEQAVGSQNPEINDRRVAGEDARCFLHEGSAQGTAATHPFAEGNWRFDQGKVSQVSRVQEADGFPVKNTFIEFSDEYPFTPRRASSLPAQVGRGKCRPA